MTVEIQRESTEYLYVGVFGDPPATTQELAFMDAVERPVTEDWETAVLVDSQHALFADASAATEGDYFVALLIGSFGGLTLNPGVYQVWLRLTDTIERPVRIVPVALEIQ